MELLFAVNVVFDKLVCGLFAINVVSFAFIVVLRPPLFANNVVSILACLQF